MPVLRHSRHQSVLPGRADRPAPGARGGIRLLCAEVVLAAVSFAVLCVVVLSVAPQLDVEPDDGAYRASIVAVTDGDYLTLSSAQAHALARKLGNGPGIPSQSSSIAQRIKQAGARSHARPHFEVTVGTVRVQIIQGPVAVGQHTPFGPLGSRDVAVARQSRPAYFASVRDRGRQFRVYTAAWPGNPGALVRTSRAANADDGELRTPLTSLTTNLDLLEDGAGLADPQAPALVRAAREQAGELDQLITDLLDLARYHEQARHRESVRLDLLTSEAVQRVRLRTPHAVIAADLRPCLVHVDPAGVDHAIRNLIDNAIKWNPPDRAVHVAVAGAHVSVTDHGPGIADGDLPRIFERFYRAPAARGMPGAGLGLAIVGSVAQANGATIEVQTGPDGSTFTLAFPPDPGAADIAPAALA